FPLTTLSAYTVMRQLRLGHGVCLLASLLFTFLPYHLGRNVTHLFLASYYLVPLMILVILWVFREPKLTCPKWLISILVCVLVSSAGIYYAFFGCFFLLISGLASGVKRRQVQPVLVAGLFVTLIVVGGLANVAPNLIYQW